MKRIWIFLLLISCALGICKTVVGYSGKKLTVEEVLGQKHKKLTVEEVLGEKRLPTLDELNASIKLEQLEKLKVLERAQPYKYYLKQEIREHYRTIIILSIALLIVLAVFFIVYIKRHNYLYRKSFPINKKFLSSLLLLFCCLGIWQVYEKAPLYRMVEGIKIKFSSQQLQNYPGAYWEKDLSVVIFRSIPIVIIGIGLYLLFLRPVRK